MRYGVRLLGLGLPLVLMGCVVEAPQPMPPKPLPQVTVCGADGLQDLVGQSAERLEVMRFGVPVRIIRPGMAVTMDYAPGRLNILIDETETIVRVSCG